VGVLAPDFISEITEWHSLQRSSKNRTFYEPNEPNYKISVFLPPKKFFHGFQRILDEIIHKLIILGFCEI
jgi:hypothetical protein